MRNLEQYPITLDEMVEACEKGSKAILDEWEATPEFMPIGDITPLALTEAAKLLRKMKELLTNEQT